MNIEFRSHPLGLPWHTPCLLGSRLVALWTERLSLDAFRRWWTGLYVFTSATLRQEIGEAAVSEQAGDAFGEAVSLQLRHAVARRFASELSKQPRIASRPDEYWSRFLAEKATLGEQLSCLLQTRNPNHELARRLQRWLGTNAPALSKYLERKGNALMILAALRGEAQHNTVTAEQLRRLYEEAEALLRLVPSEAVGPAKPS